MPVRHSAPLGAPIWIDLTSSDLDRAVDFYGTVFGWTFESAGPDHGGYLTATKSGRPVAGLMANNPESGPPDGWTTYFHSADINATVATLASAGGATYLGPMEVPTKGFMSIATDPSGAPFGLWQPLEHRGFELIGEAGAPTWHQLTTRDYRAAVDFYRQVFGWQTEQLFDNDEFRYTTAWFEDKQSPALGVWDGAEALPDGVPSHWTVYFGAEDVDTTLQVITDNGGIVAQAAEDTPYGRLAAAADPTGAMFNLSSLRN